MQPLEFFVGVNWSLKEHQVCVVNMEGKVCGQRDFSECLHHMFTVKSR